jgi:prepilin peptidase CpaA
VDFLSSATAWLHAQGDLLFPLLLALWIAWGDVRTKRIPNYLTFGGALAGLGFRWGSYGLWGLMDGLLGLILGLALLLLPYLRGGMGAGDVKALAALGSWLGPRLIMYLSLYMALCGGLLILGVLWWRGLLWFKIRQGWVSLLNWFLCRPHGGSASPPARGKTETVPYGLALALGMVLLCWRGA